MYDWAKFRRVKGAVKLHIMLDHDGYLPCFGLVTGGSISDVKAAWKIAFTPGTIVVDDRGYNDYRLFSDWTKSGVFFVTRMKDNVLFKTFVCRHIGQCGEDPDWDGLDFDAVATLPANIIPVRLEPFKSGGAAAHESVPPIAI
jgi:hypothetical protein